ncbi:MAG: hypothetical protein NTY22_08485 [Proteobacteria bacterium]|nr:hypothetical protein [Pseudomonadota bacterium]
MKMLMVLAVCLLTPNLLFAEPVNDENGIAINNSGFVYAGQNALVSNKVVKIRKPASVDGMQKYYRFFDSKEDNYKKLYY